MATYTITALDPAKPEGDEGRTEFRFQIDRAGPFKPGVVYETVFVKLDSPDLDAFDGFAFDAADGRIGGNNDTKLSVGFEPGQTQAIITVSIHGDTLVELDEVLHLTLTGYHEASRDDAGQGTVDAFAINDSAVSIILNDDEEADHKAEQFHVDLIEEDGVTSPEERDFILTVPDFNELFNQLFNRLLPNLLLMSQDGEFDDAEILAMDTVFLGKGFDEEYMLARDQEIASAETLDPPAEIPLLAWFEESGLFAGLDAAPDPAALIDDLYLSGGHIDLVDSYHDVAGDGIAVFTGERVALDLSHGDINAAAGELGFVVLPNDRFFYVDSNVLELADGSLRFDVERGENAGTAYRIYQAVFARTPDEDGLAFWLDQIDRGASLDAVAEGFVASAEFASVYGTAATDLAFVERLYQNILSRDGERAGIDFWTELLINDDVERAVVLAGFSESFENVTGVAPAIAGGIFLPDEPPVGPPVAPPTQPLTLTRGIDNLVGTPGDDVFRAAPDGGLQTLNSGDTIIGGGGNDRLEGELPDGEIVNPTLRGLTDLFLRFTGGGTLDATNIAFDGTLWSDASTPGANFTNVTPQLSVGIRGTGAASSSTVTATFISDVGNIRVDNTTNEIFVTPSPLAILDVAVLNESVLAVEASQTEELFIGASGDFDLAIRSADVLESIRISSDSSFELQPFVVKADQFLITGASGDNKLVLLAASADQTMAILTNNGDDEIRTGDANDVIDAGGGGDIVVPGSGIDRIALGAGFDRVVFKSGDSDESVDNLTVITDFNVNEDVLDLSAFAETTLMIFNDPLGRQDRMRNDINSLGQEATLRNALDIAEEYAMVNEVAQFTFQGSTYVYIDESDLKGGYNAGDFVVRLNGEMLLLATSFAL